MVALEHPSGFIEYLPVAMAWSAAEISAAIIALSLPALRGLFVFFRNKNKTTNQSNTYGSSSIGLSSFPRQPNHTSGGKRDFQLSVDIDTPKAQSQEALCENGASLIEQTVRVGSFERRVLGQ